jgi:hypothetical protein
MKIYKVLTSGNTGESLQNISEPSSGMKSHISKSGQKMGVIFQDTLFIQTGDSKFKFSDGPISQKVISFSH